MPEQPEVDARRDSIVAEGDDEDHVLPPQDLDAFGPEAAAPTAGGRVALWVGLLVLAAIVAVAIVYAVR
ncbi:MAG: hypothetical protein ACRDM1_04440 [Gaiellaceae bacterium]